MKVSTIAFTMATSLAAASAEPLFVPSGAILGNLDTISQLPPHIVLDYVASCANVSEVMLPDDSECLFDNFIALLFPQEEFGDSCSSPNVTASHVLTNLQAANDMCTYDFTDYLGSALSLVLQVFAAESCWASLCDAQALLHVESQYLEQCTGVDLPYPTVSSDTMGITQDEEDHAILTCMLEHIMNTPASDFGFADPPVVCWPPAYDNIGAVCLDSLAKPAYDKCTENPAFFEALHGEFKYMSMSMSMSMQIEDHDDDDDDDMMDEDMMEMMLLGQFCDILEGITTDKGLECLGIICDNPTAMPSGAPSDEMSAMPSDVTSAMPSSAPTEDPSAMPSSSPTEGTSAMPSETPSSMPSTSPSAGPSSSPSAMPSSMPSAEPSSAPSSSPTLQDLQHIVEVELVAEFAIDMASSNVPDLLDETVEDSILDALSSFGTGVDVTVLTVNGNTLRRRLQNVVPVRFRVQATEPCYLPDCTVLATNMIADLNDALSNAVVDGSMETLIRQEATARTVDELTTANVIANSYQLISSDSQLNDPVVISNPEGVQSSAVLVSTATSLVLLVLVPFLAF